MEAGTETVNHAQGPKSRVGSVRSHKMGQEQDVCVPLAYGYIFPSHFRYTSSTSRRPFIAVRPFMPSSKRETHEENTHARLYDLVLLSALLGPRMILTSQT